MFAETSTSTKRVSRIVKSWNASTPCKVHTFWEGHKTLRNIHLTFVLCSASEIKISQNFVTFSECMNFRKPRAIFFHYFDSPTSTETNVSVSYDHDFGHQITMSMRLMSKYLPQGSFNCWFRKHFHNSNYHHTCV